MEIHISNPVTFWQNVNIPFFRYSSFHLFIRISHKYMLKFVCSQEKQDIIRPRREPPELPEKVWKYTYLLIFYMMKIKCISTFFSRHLPQCSWIVKILLVRGDVISCVNVLRHYNALYLWGVNYGLHTKSTSINSPRKTMIPQDLLCEYLFGVGALWLFLTRMYPAVRKN